MTDWKRVLRAIAPKGKRWIINGVADAMPQMIETAQLNTKLRLAQFLAQCAKESDGFQTTKEYASGAAYEGRDRLPDGRVDLGNSQPGDGKRFKGRGIIQTTGRANYAAGGAALGVDLIATPQIAERFPYAALLAATYWRSKKINRAADRDDVRAVTKLVNGGYNGLAERIAYLKAAKRALAAPEPKAWPSEAVTAADLRKAGSRTMDGVAIVKTSGKILVGDQALSGGTDYLEKASNAADTASDIASKVQNVQETAQSATGVFAWVHNNPGMVLGLQIGLGVIAVAAIAYALYGLSKIIRAKVEDTNDALAALPEEVADDEPDEGEAGEPLDDDAIQGAA